ncbi:DUF402 domain-containing protein [Saccharopolyspora sp. HNM0983]|uniref:DUF402 domain-containing protein n=2 Tax=Saccharopolyspora montiporae TaxID=2781240 RepID=A0A929BDE3_9PSEU|nr:DUF402 domain-containing protein [Saccharopolyspora sp. HNM0983]MBE9375558.1 DUF402 domain-containing protein [Saccharopolyspora sp. HNM0983]
MGLPVHPPKVEVFDLRAGTNTDPKGHERTVDEFRLTSAGLYVAREVVDHHRFAALETWLLPAVGLRLTRWRLHPGLRPNQDEYLDVADIEQDGDVWRTRDLYLDIELHRGRAAELVDVDEYTAAVAAGLLDGPAAQRALRTAHVAADGLARNGYDSAAWLREHGIEVSWRDQPTEHRLPEQRNPPPSR